MNTIKAVKRGLMAALAKPDPQKYKAGGKLVTCSHCAADGFRPYHLTKFVSEGLLRELYGLECTECSHLELFAKQPIEVADAG